MKRAHPIPTPEELCAAVRRWNLARRAWQRSHADSPGREGEEWAEVLRAARDYDPACRALMAVAARLGEE